jgi:ferredoxin--NADP+ reductase/benzoate/toluate 1,2-dioxygenase reductase subunit
MDPLMQEKLPDVDVVTGFHEITHVRFLTDTTFVLRFKRENLKFKAGQRIIVGLQRDPDQREYSVYSGENDDYLEILVKEISDGNLSVKLKQCKPGQFLQVNGPFGSFGSENYDRLSRKLIFIATGTGISPFHSIIRSSPAINYTLFHGVRFRNEAYEREEYDASRYIICTSKESSGGRKGRVTKFLSEYKVTPEMLFFLCGNGNMIYEVYHILRNKGIPSEKIFSEIYF